MVLFSFLHLPFFPNTVQFFSEHCPMLPLKLQPSQHSPPIWFMHVKQILTKSLVTTEQNINRLWLIISNKIDRVLIMSLFNQAPR